MFKHRARTQSCSVHCVLALGIALAMPACRRAWADPPVTATENPTVEELRRELLEMKDED
jgi:hypothetical protein